MPLDLFDMRLRALRRDRAARMGAELFLHERAFEDVLDRLALFRRPFRRALLLGCPDSRWPGRLGVDQVDVAEPGPLFAASAKATLVVEDRWQPKEAAYDLCVAVGTLDTVNDLPAALRTLRRSLALDSLLVGVVAGGNSLPRLREAMHAADHVSGSASPRVHPRIEAASLAPLLSASGFVMPVVDVDRVRVSYTSLDRLVGDLRRMGATNILSARSRQPLGQAARARAAATFGAAAESGSTTEIFELLHFAAWTPAEG